MPGGHYERARAAIESAAKSATAEEIVGASVDGLCGVLGDEDVLDAGTACAGAAAGFTLLYSTWKLVKSRKELGESPNPLFVLNGHGDERDPASPVTLKYMRTRLGKSIAGAGISFAGSASSKAMADVDVIGGLMHVNATGSTLAHLMKLRAIAASYKQSETIQRWIEVVAGMKARKAAVRGTQIIGAFVPGAGLPLGIATTIAKIGIKLSMTKVCHWTAAELHWRAFAEQAIRKGAIGPAGRILGELFARRGATRIFGQYDVASIIREPCGWMAVADKICLI